MVGEGFFCWFVGGWAVSRRGLGLDYEVCFFIL